MSLATRVAPPATPALSSSAVAPAAPPTATEHPFAAAASSGAPASSSRTVAPAHLSGTAAAADGESGMFGASSANGFKPISDLVRPHKEQAAEIAAKLKLLLPPGASHNITAMVSPPPESKLTLRVSFAGSNAAGMKNAFQTNLQKLADAGHVKLEPTGHPPSRTDYVMFSINPSFLSMSNEELERLAKAPVAAVPVKDDAAVDADDSAAAPPPSHADAASGAGVAAAARPDAPPPPTEEEFDEFY